MLIVGGVSHVEFLVLYELWAGERLDLEKTIPRGRRIGRPISVSAVPPGPGIDIRRSCRFGRGVLRALSALPGGLGRFMPCGIGANHCGLRHIGWEKSRHGLTPGPRGTSSVSFLNKLLVLFGVAGLLAEYSSDEEQTARFRSSVLTLLYLSNERTDIHSTVRFLCTKLKSPTTLDATIEAATEIRQGHRRHGDSWSRNWKSSQTLTGQMIKRRGRARVVR